MTATGMDSTRERPGSTKEQKLGVVLLGLFGVLAIGMGTLQMRNTIYGPFVLRPVKNAKPAFLSDERVRLQQVDTDHDGLNDYEELQTYGTSPYIPDTDSDGVKDAEEIQKGTDPNCPESQNCGSAVAAGGTAVSVAEPVGSLGDSAATAPFPAGTAGVIDPLAALEQLAGNTAELRKLLVASGKMTQAEVSAVDDVTLRQVVQQFLAEQKGS